jgi:hypothetical protein
MDTFKGAKNSQKIGHTKARHGKPVFFEFPDDKLPLGSHVVTFTANFPFFEEHYSP